MPYVRPAIANAQPLLIKQIAAETGRLVSEGATILSLAQGQPNLPLFPAAVDAMTAHIAAASLPYTDVAGLPAVRATAARFVSKCYTLPAHAAPLTGSNVLITAGAAQSVYNCLALSVGCVDDVVLSPLPAYGLYLHQSNVLGGTFDAVPTQKSNGFKPTVAELRQAFSKHTVTDEVTGQRRCKVRSLVLCFPNNPCGSLLTETEARDLAAFLDEQLQLNSDPLGEDFSVVLDEVYLGLHSVGAHHSILLYASPRLLANCMLVLSASKGLGAAPGLRAGFLTVFDPALLADLIKIQMACTANASSVAQVGLQASLEHVMSAPEAIEGVFAYYKERTSLCVARLNEIGRKYFTPTAATAAAASSSADGSAAAAPAPVVVAVEPQGTFYVMADFSAWAGMETDRDIQVLLRDQYTLSEKKVGVACVPGCAFNLDPRAKLIRFSCAVEMPVLSAAMDVVEEAVRAHVAAQLPHAEPLVSAAAAAPAPQ